MASQNRFYTVEEALAHVGYDMETLMKMSHHMENDMETLMKVQMNSL